MSHKKQNKKSVPKLLSGRRGIILIALLAMLILLVSIVSMSFSWFTPEVKPATGMRYQADAAVRSESCSITKNYAGTVTDGKITYDTSVNLTGEETISLVSGEDTIQYYKTVIENSAATATNVSLYIAALPAPSTAKKAYGLGVAFPSNSYHKISTAQTDYYIIRNAYISEAKNSKNGLLEIEWFVKTGGEAVTINFSNLYLMYN